MALAGDAERLPEAARAHMTARAFDSEFRVAFDTRFVELFRMLERYPGDESLAADVAQETFVRLYRRGEMPDDLLAWLVSVALNQARDELRRRSRQSRLLQRRMKRSHWRTQRPRRRMNFCRPSGAQWFDAHWMHSHRASARCCS